MKPEQERLFWAQVHVERGGALPGGCWIWKGKKTTAGYGWMVARGKRAGWETTHRLAWEHFRGPIPKGKWVLHHCDVPACCNPDHLYLGTTQDNTRDRHDRGRDYRWPRHHFARLTPKDVIKIRASRGVITRERLADKYGVSKQAITHIWQRRNWAWVS